jgi:hypothetical protein
MVATPGTTIPASDMIDAQRKAQYRGNRTSSRVQTGAIGGTITPILRIDNCILLAGKAYFISLPGFRGDSATDNDLLGGEIRYSTSGVATTASPEIAKSEQSDQRTMTLGGWIFPSVTATYSFLVTGRCAVSGSGGTPKTITYYGEPEYNLVVEYCGDAPADTGVDL